MLLSLSIWFFHFTQEIKGNKVSRDGEQDYAGLKILNQSVLMQLYGISAPTWDNSRLWGQENFWVYNKTDNDVEKYVILW